MTYSYDHHDNVTSISYGSALPLEVSGTEYIYSNGRLERVKVRIGNTSYIAKVYTYTPWGAVDTVTDYYDFRNDNSKYITLSYGYDDLLRVSEMVYTKEDDTVLESHRYSYDKAGKILSEENWSSLSDLNETRHYGYDILGRLESSDIYDVIEIEGGETEEVLRTETVYTYDKVGNRLSKTENGTVTDYTYNCLDQLITETKGPDTLQYSYDGNGNQIRVHDAAGTVDEDRAFTYTPSGMMKTFTEGANEQHNLYTGDGVRVRKDDNGAVTNYFYQEGSVLFTTDDVDITDQGTTLKSFNLLNISDIFGTSRTDGNNTDYYFYLEDQRGSTTEIIDSNCDRVVSYQYNDFGEVTEEKADSYSNFINEIQYTGSIYDSLTGLLYLNARFYDPSTGRFISQDTYRGEQDEPDTWHLYAYCANDPINYTDPSGHFIETVLDVASVGLSLYTMIKEPSLSNAAFLLWDIGAMVIPAVPGSYIAKGISKAGEAGKLSKASKLKVFVPTKLSDLQKRTGKLIIGSYGKLKNMKFGRTVERHHIIEKRFKVLFDISSDKWEAVVLDKKVHQKITKRFRRWKKYGSNYKKMTKEEVMQMVNWVYRDMPELRGIAQRQVKEHYISPKNPRYSRIMKEVL